MDVRQEGQLRDKFMLILVELSRDQAFFNDPKKRAQCFIDLEKLYHDNKFRHYYSDIFSVLNGLHRGELDGDINILGQNLDWIKRGYQPKNPDPDSTNGALKDISKQINKLYDHVNLDISRILAGDANSRFLLQDEKINEINKNVAQASEVLNFTQSILLKSEDTILNLSEKLETTEQKLNEMNSALTASEKKLLSVEKKLDSAQKEYISILGLFATIVLAFIGSIVFSTSVLENMHKSSIYRVTLVILLIAFTIINVIYLIFRLIDRIVNSDSKKVNIKPLVISDIVIVVLIFGVGVAWYCGAIEKRNEAIYSADIPSEIAISNSIEVNGSETVETQDIGQTVEVIIL